MIDLCVSDNPERAYIPVSQKKFLKSIKKEKKYFFLDLCKKYINIISSSFYQLNNKINK
jgi:hypothetical protein